MGYALRKADIARGERRSSPRRVIAHESTLRTDDRLPIDVVVRDLSSDGCSVDTHHLLQIGCIVSIGLVGIGSVAARVVRSTASGYGCELVSSLPDATAEAAFRANPIVAGAFPSFLIPAHDSGTPVPWPLAVRAGLVLALATLGWIGIAAAVL